MSAHARVVDLIERRLDELAEAELVWKPEWIAKDVCDRFEGALEGVDEETADFYSAAVDGLERMSISRYEISNFAKPGYESAHNLKYWNMETYLGFGSDAHSFDGKKRWANASSPAEYIERCRSGGSTRAQVSEVDENRGIEDRLMTGLRQMAGVRFSPNEFAAYQRQLGAMAANGWLELTADNIWRLTPAGVMFSNEVFQQFLRD